MLIRPTELRVLLASVGLRLADTRGLGPRPVMPLLLPGLLRHRRLGAFTLPVTSRPPSHRHAVKRSTT
ncbi:hypothetical protein [Streptomyces sp. KL116D]|uniref:hypothetical protein n=1 Tax=Streptomyces sp. KL116D TaxID=3045152 RepID=UPI0035566C50